MKSQKFDPIPVENLDSRLLLEMGGDYEDWQAAEFVQALSGWSQHNVHLALHRSAQRCGVIRCWVSEGNAPRWFNASRVRMH